MAIFKLHIPILDDIKEKGLGSAVRDNTDDVVTRVTAGLNPSDIRSVLRDDPPVRLPKSLPECHQTLNIFSRHRLRAGSQHLAQHDPFLVIARRGGFKQAGRDTDPLKRHVTVTSVNQVRTGQIKLLVGCRCRVDVRINPLVKIAILV